MLGAILVLMFVVFVAIGVPISFALGVVSFTGIACMPTIPNAVVFTKMFNGLNSFTLLALHSCRQPDERGRYYREADRMHL